MDHDREICYFECESCGDWGATMEACCKIRAANQPLFRCATRQASEIGNPLVLKAADIDGLAKPHAETTIARNIEKLLAHVARHSLRAGQSVRLFFTETSRLLTYKLKTNYSIFSIVPWVQGFSSMLEMDIA